MATEGIRTRSPDGVTPDGGTSDGPLLSGARQRSARPGLAALCLLAASAVLLRGAINAAVITDAVFWGGLALGSYIYGLLFVVLAVRGPGHGPASWRLGPWMMIWAGTMYGLATLGLDQRQNTAAVEIILTDVIRALWLVAAGTTMWFVGYLTGPGRLLRGVTTRGVEGLGRRFSADIRGPVTPWLLYGIGTTARLLSTLTSSRFGYVGNAASAVSTASWYGQIVLLLGLCGQLGVAAAALQVFRQRLRSARVTLIILFLAEIGYAIASGQKENYANAVLAVAIPYTAARNRLPKAILVTVGIIFLAVVIPFTATYRSAARETGGSALSAGQAVAAAPQILRNTLDGGGSLLAAIPESIGYLLARGQDIDAPAIIMQRTPGQIPYSDPVQLVTGPLSALIPRALWPGKPILATGYEFGQEYFELPSTIYSSSAITPIGDLYRHGGWPPVLIGMLLFGCVISLFDDFLDVRGNPHTVFLTLFLFPSMVMSEQDWVTLLAAIPAFILLWWFTVALAFGRRRDPR
jgi:hypothetical protein